MDFQDSAEEAAYRRQVRAWLRENAAPKQAERVSAPLPESERLMLARAWQARKAAAGYARVNWPSEWGGCGGTALQQIIFTEEESAYDVPTGFFGIGLGMCIPTLMKYADQPTGLRFAAPALRGEEIWCQLFSEPAAGSDLAALRTRAQRSGDGWIVNGQKVWTTGAHYSDFGLLLVRTDPELPKHKGLTMFWIDMRSPGIQIRPIHQISGGNDFNEVYFSDVLVPYAQRLGAVGEGWKVSLVTLMNERVEGGKSRGPEFDSIVALASATPRGAGALLEDSAFRQRLADWYVQAEGLRFTRLRTLTALSRGQTPGPESSIGKLVAVARMQEIASELIDAQDQFGAISDPALAALGGRIHHDLLHASGLRIAGGTDEILRNIIAERVLGLPGEIRPDKDLPFNELPFGR